MKMSAILIVHLLVTLVKLLLPGGVRTIVAENMALKQQLITLKRKQKRCPKLSSFERFFFGFIANLTGKHCVYHYAVVIKPATILRFRKALIKRKYHKLFTNKTTRKPGKMPPEQWIVDLVIEIKQKNPTFGYGRIAMQIHQAFSVEVSRYTVGRILRIHKDKLPPNDSHSWLSFLGNMKDSLWSIDLFRCESINLKSHWAMVVMDQYSRRIVGFAVHAGDCDGAAVCRMFNSILSGNSPPKYLSTHNDPLFQFNRWQANLRIIDVEEIKSVPHVPTSHPFIERLIGTVRRECLDKTLFFNSRDLQKKLNDFQKYYNSTRAHSSLNQKTPAEIAFGAKNRSKCYKNTKINWESYCNGLYQLPHPALN